MNFLIKLHKDGKLQIVEPSEEIIAEIIDFIEKLNTDKINRYRDKTKGLLK